jgi:hypothetical protein
MPITRCRSRILTRMKSTEGESRNGRPSVSRPRGLPTSETPGHSTTILNTPTPEVLPPCRVAATKDAVPPHKKSGRTAGLERGRSKCAALCRTSAEPDGPVSRNAHPGVAIDTTRTTANGPRAGRVNPSGRRPRRPRLREPRGIVPGRRDSGSLARRANRRPNPREPQCTVCPPR